MDLDCGKDAEEDRPYALLAGLTSSSREAIRPIIRKADIPYFYPSLYEGGACDKQTFVTGSSASQQLSVLINWAVETYGKKIFIMAPDYNFGTISAHWVREYAKRLGAEVAGEDILALTVTDYAPTIQKIQAAKSDFVVALPVGANQTGFLEQFAAAGLKDSIGVVSTNYGSGNQQVVVSPAGGRGPDCQSGLLPDCRHWTRPSRPAGKSKRRFGSLRKTDRFPKREPTSASAIDPCRARKASRASPTPSSRHMKSDPFARSCNRRTFHRQ